MNAQKIAEELDLFLDYSELKKIKRDAGTVVNAIKREIKRRKINAQVFIGGSFAKGTMVKSEEGYDVDVFVRFNEKYKDISEMLEKIVGKLQGCKIEKVHGSRDYFRVYGKENLIIEIIPVIRIRKPSEAKNVTDLSYFHVNYVRKKINDKLAKEIIITKAFCKAQGVYGAESYIQGLSGYAIECLMIYYKTFEKMAKEIVNSKNQIIIDPEKAFGRGKNILLELNESKTKNRIVLVDPTWKERNVLAALSDESFGKLKGALARYLKRPSKKQFEIKEFNREEFLQSASKKSAETVVIKVNTEKQAGDIAGTKLKKFYRHFLSEIAKFFEILDSQFIYSGDKSAEIYLAVKPKKEIIKKGPPVEMKKHAEEFRKLNKDVFESNGLLYSKLKIDEPAGDFIKKYIVKIRKTAKDMDISELKIV